MNDRDHNDDTQFGALDATPTAIVCLLLASLLIWIFCR